MYDQNSGLCFAKQVLFLTKEILMPPRPLESLGVLVREKRKLRKLREVATEIGISAATLLRVEGGKIPDVATFGKICNWLQIDPGSFLGFEEQKSKTKKSPGLTDHLTHVSAHMRTDSTAHQMTLQALAQMILLARNSQFEER
jgi:transcriptional regulator with XRE-family HTH domain